MEIYIANLPYGAGDQDLRNLFEPYGEVESCRVVKDRETGRSRGFGFVKMRGEAETKDAIAELNGVQLEGRAISVREATPKPDHTARGGFRDQGQGRGGQGNGGGGGYGGGDRNQGGYGGNRR